jgi:hypothetical protein
MHIDEPHSPFWHRLRRPSTLVLLGAGLLAADLLRRLAPWTDATFIGLTAALALALLALWRLRYPTRRSRGPARVAVLLPATAKPLCDPHLARPAPRDGLLRYRIFLFALVVFALITLPALFAQVTR